MVPVETVVEIRSAIIFASPIYLYSGWLYLCALTVLSSSNLSSKRMGHPLTVATFYKYGCRENDETTVGFGIEKLPK